MKLFFLLLAFCLAIPNSAQSQSIRDNPKDKLELCYLGKAAPKIEDMEFQGITDYTESGKGEGYSAKWYNNETFLFVHLFDLDLKNISDSHNSAPVNKAISKTLKELKKRLKQGVYEQVEIGSAVTRQIGDRKFRYVPIKFRYKGRPGESLIAVTAMRGKLFKIRLTTFVVNPTKKIDLVLTNISKLIPIQSKERSDCPILSVR